MPTSDSLQAIARKAIPLDLPDGRQLILTQLTLRDFACIREECLRRYKRARISTWTDNADLLPPDVRQTALMKAIEEASRIDISDLPRRRIRIPVEGTDEHGEQAYRELEVSYADYWAATEPEGMLFTVWRSAIGYPSQQHLTPAQLNNDYFGDIASLRDAFMAVDELSTSAIQKKSLADSHEATVGRNANHAYRAAPDAISEIVSHLNQ